MLVLRVLGLVNAGYYGYALAIWGLSSFGIDLPAHFGIPGRPATIANSIIQKANQLALIVFAGFVTSLTVQNLLNPELNIVPWVTVVVFGGICLESLAFRRILRRILLGGLSVEFRLGDVLISDCLVSYSNVFVDFALAVHMLLNNSSTISRTSVHPFVMVAASIPIGIRIKQCFIDWKRTRQRQHLANLLKYFISNIPVSMRIQAINNPQILNVVPYALCVSALYSLLWDIVYDWKLVDSRLRKFPSWSYRFAVLADIVLRFAWTLGTPQELRIFQLEVLEILRRFMWVFFRVEHEKTEDLAHEQ